MTTTSGARPGRRRPLVRAASGALVLVLAGSLAGCGGGDDDPTVGPAASLTPSQSDSVSPSPSPSASPSVSPALPTGLPSIAVPLTPPPSASASPTPAAPSSAPGAPAARPTTLAATAQTFFDAIVAGDRAGTARVAPADVVAQFEPYDPVPPNADVESPRYSLDGDRLSMLLRPTITVSCKVTVGTVVSCAFGE